jgi:hypothetical protein
MIYCVWYPSGGFGHFINGILSLYGKGFKRPVGQFKFSNTGDSHSLDLVVPKYTGATSDYHYNFDPDYNHSVLVDLGINSNSRNFMQAFPESKIIKMCYTDTSWPIVARTMIDKAMKSTVETELTVDTALWHSTEPWTQREKYFLFLRDHSLRWLWKDEPGVHCVYIDSLLDYTKLKSVIEDSGAELAGFKAMWSEWYTHNKKYFDPTTNAEQVLDKIKHQENIDLTNVTDLWTQAVIYYFIWLKFGKEVPHNDFENFFKDTNQIRTWLYQ